MTLSTLNLILKPVNTKFTLIPARFLKPVKYKINIKTGTYSKKTVNKKLIYKAGTFPKPETFSKPGTKQQFSSIKNASFRPNLDQTPDHARYAWLGL